MKFLQGIQKEGIKIPNWDFGQILKDLEWRCPYRVKTTILCDFLGIFEIFRGKGTLDHESRKFYLHGISPTHQFRQLCLGEFFLDRPNLDGASGHEFES